MRIFSSVLALGLVSSSVADFGEPIVSLDKVISLVKSTTDLGIDSAKFVSVKIEEALSDSHRVHYSKFAQHVHEYKELVVEMYKKSPLKVSVEIITGTVMGVVAQVYERLNRLNHLYLDSVIEEFEYRFPSSSGLLGQELIDRALTFLWLFLSIRCVLKLVFCRGRCGGCPMNRKL